VTNRVNWTLARLADEIAAREGVTISKSQLSKGASLEDPDPIGWTAARLGRLSFHTRVEATDAVRHFRRRRASFVGAVTNRVNWTLARLADEIAAREGVTISKSHLSKALR
jgi:transposase